MKHFLLPALIFVFCVAVNAQDKKFEYQDVCGDPRMESSIWLMVSGKVIKIIDGDSVIFKESNGRKKTIDLVAINSSLSEAAAKDFLTRNVLDKKVEVSFSMSSLEKEKVWGEIRRNGREINRLMIEQGISSFQKPAPYSFSNYTTCVYRQVEEKAKREKIGIWAK